LMVNRPVTPPSSAALLALETAMKRTSRTGTAGGDEAGDGVGGAVPLGDRRLRVHRGAGAADAGGGVALGAAGGVEGRAQALAVLAFDRTRDGVDDLEERLAGGEGRELIDAEAGRRVHQRPVCHRVPQGPSPPAGAVTAP
jgi:hypothetical protein